MIFPAEAYTDLGSGLVMILASYYTFRKIWLGSKSSFAYTLIGFTLLDGAQNLANFFTLAFPHPVYLSYQTLYAGNEYAN
jgi:hypothetical protein